MTTTKPKDPGLDPKVAESMLLLLLGQGRPKLESFGSLFGMATVGLVSQGITLAMLHEAVDTLYARATEELKQHGQ